MNRAKSDNTLVRQMISIFPADRVDTVYEVEKESMLAQPYGTTRYEVPFPTTGDESIAFRENDLNAPERNVTYSLLFAKNNVYETITMGGTNTRLRNPQGSRTESGFGYRDAGHRKTMFLVFWKE